eukprot:229490-Chlamydomonas_euryale.AAC.1
MLPALCPLPPLQEDLARWQRRVEELEEEQVRRQASYMRREAEQAASEAALRAELAAARGSGGGGGSEGCSRAEAQFRGAQGAISLLHAEVLDEIEGLLRKQEVALKHEEGLTVRRFKDKLSAIEAQVAGQHASAAAAGSAWTLQSRNADLHRELDRMQAIASQLDTQYKLAAEECARLRAAYGCQRDDRDNLVRQVVALKHDKLRMAAEMAALADEAAEAAAERDALMDAAAAAAAAAQAAAAAKEKQEGEGDEDEAGATAEAQTAAGGTARARPQTAAGAHEHMSR